MAKKGLLESIVSGVLGEGSASTGDFLDTIEDALSDLVGSDAASDGLLEGIGSVLSGLTGRGRNGVEDFRVREEKNDLEKDFGQVRHSEKDFGFQKDYDHCKINDGQKDFDRCKVYDG